jgi:predicted GIY-YIG superfamily endonuclease
MQGKIPAVYMMANKKDGVIYTGVTSNLLVRHYEHNNGIKSGFCSRYGCNNLVYYEFYENMESAILREKQIKGGSRKKKIELVEASNPKWLDLINKLV